MIEWLRSEIKPIKVRYVCRKDGNGKEWWVVQVPCYFFFWSGLYWDALFRSYRSTMEVSGMFEPKELDSFEEAQKFAERYASQVRARQRKTVSKLNDMFV